MTLKQLQIFIAVVDTRSFSKAGELASLAQSTTSQHIKVLEDELGVRLLDRSTSQVSLTAVGKLFYDHAVSIIQGCEAARAAVRRFQGLDEATIRVGASTIPAACLIPDLIGALATSYPGIQLEVIQGDSREVIQMLLNDQVELAVVGSRPEQPELSAQVVMTDRIILTARPAVAATRKLQLEQLHECTLVTREPGSGTRLATDMALRRAGLEPKSLTISAQLGSSEAVRRAVLGSDCYAFISALAIEPELVSGTLLEIPIEGLKIERALYLAQKRGRSLSPAAARFTQLLIQTP